MVGAVGERERRWGERDVERERERGGGVLELRCFWYRFDGRCVTAVQG